MTLPSDGPNTDAVLTAAGDIPTLQVGATTARLVATGTQTDGGYGLFRWEMSAASGGATPHFHRTFSEAFYVLDGRIKLFDGTDLAPGWGRGLPVHPTTRRARVPQRQRRPGHDAHPLRPGPAS